MTRRKASVPQKRGLHPSQTPDASPLGARIVVGALCLMVGVVPLAYLTDVYECVASPKLFVLHLCIALACLGWLLQTRRGRNLRLVSTPLLLPALCWVGVGLLSAPSTAHPLDTFSELTNQAALLVLFFVVANTLTLEYLKPVLWASAGAGLTVALIGILQYHGLAFLDIPSAALPSATFGNRNFAAEYLVCAIPLSGLLFLTARRRAALLVSGLSTTLMGIFLVYTRTRAAWVGLAGALLCTGGLLTVWPGLRRPVMEALRSALDRDRRRLALGFLALFIALSALPPRRSAEVMVRKGLPFLRETKADVASTAASFLQKDVGMGYRLAAWSATLRMVADRPLLGVGPGGWARVYPAYDGGATTRTEMSMNNPHNDYLWIASEYGLIGLGVYLWMLTAAFRCLLNTVRRPEPFSRLSGLMMALSLLAMLGTAFFGFPKDQPHAAMFSYLIFGVAASATQRERDKENPSIPSSPARAYRGTAARTVLFLLLIVSLTAVDLSRRRLAFDHRLLVALSWGMPPTNWNAVLDAVERALAYGTFRPRILYVKGVALKNLRRPAEAEEALRKALVYAPHAWYLHAGLSSVCLGQGRLQDALAHARTALSLCPDATEVRKGLGVIYYQLKDADRAEEEFQAVLRAQPEDAGAYLNLGNLRAARNQPDSAMACYRQALSLNPKMPRVHFALGNAAYALGRYQEALSAYRNFLALAGDDTTYVPFARERIIRIEAEAKK
ncbi:MAG: tetratricopeptide repeat protein [Candidatus Latescibacteria bacterium]|nr:tetratricopeptide repeat protein [Candidatus Latescibacterota bacterium]